MIETELIYYHLEKSELNLNYGWRNSKLLFTLLPSDVFFSYLLTFLPFINSKHVPT